MVTTGPAPMPAYRRSACRVCRADALDLILDLGEQPLANSFLRTEELADPEPHYPLQFCRCASCGHAQLSGTVAPEVMFRKYLYVSGVSESFRAHFAEYARDVEARFVPTGGLVVEIGSNDGTLLRAFDRSRTRILGVEPATNIADLANAAGIDTLNEFFGAEIGRSIARERGQADAIIANNVVAHIDDLHGLVAGVDALLAPNGVFVAEFPYAGDFLERVEYDTIYHEHLSYFTSRAAAALFDRFGLSLFDVRRTLVHGGSLRLFVGRRRSRSTELEALLADERAKALDTEAPFRRFARRVAEQRVALVELVDRLVRDGSRIAAYGAAAKGNTMLNYCGLNASRIAYIADRSTLKQGLYSPGGHIPVRDATVLAEDRPDYTLLLAWNFEGEILRQQDAYLARGGRFIVPIPLPRIVT